jgi:hypothetical protein
VSRYTDYAIAVARETQHEKEKCTQHAHTYSIYTGLTTEKRAALLIGMQQ